MKFEQLLARRYIFSQKRHTLLTICSIAIAAAFMAMVFTCFTTVSKCSRAVTFDKTPYHVLIYEITTEQASELAKESMIESIKLKPIPNDIQRRSSARIMLKKGIKDINVYLDDIFTKYDFGFNITDDGKFEINRPLMNKDLIDDQARFNWLTVVCLLYIFALFFAACLRMIIDTAFEVSSKEKEKQFGVLQSVGATPKQIVRIITSEAIFQCIAAVPLGTALGVGLSYIAYHNVIKSGLLQELLTVKKTEELIHFHVSWLALAAAASLSVVWVLFSAYGVGMRIIKMSPIQAISNRSNKIVKVKKHSVFGAFFGWKGKLASRNVRRQKKRYIITLLSIIVSITLISSSSIVMKAFTSMMNISNIGLFGQEDLQDFELRLIQVTNDKSYNSLDDPLALTHAVNDLEASGYFKNINYYYANNGKIINEEETGLSGHCEIQYLTREKYNKFIEKKTGISYDEMTEKGYLLISQRNKDQIRNEKITDLNLELTFVHNISDEEYEKMSEDEKKEVKTSSSRINMDESNKRRTSKKTYEQNFDIVSELNADDIINPRINLAEDTYLNVILVSTVDRYEKNDHSYYYDFTPFNYLISCDLKDSDDVNEVLHYIDNSHYVTMDIDWRKIKTEADLEMFIIRTAVAFLSVIIALIAAVNMINIITTGLINRNSEIASMQCVGMTEGQLYKESIIECLQYVIPAAIGSVIISSATMLGTKAFLKAVQLDADEMFTYMNVNIGTPFPVIALASVAALIIAIVSTLITLKSMQKRGLIDRMKMVE